MRSSGYGVAIRSATEPFDTTSPIGAFLFQLLGSLAELEKSTIAERTSLGRNRVASDGGYTGGPIPIGYDLDAENRFIAVSAHRRRNSGMTEADMVRELFQRVAGGEATLNGRRRTPGRARHPEAAALRRRKTADALIERPRRWRLQHAADDSPQPDLQGRGRVKLSATAHVAVPDAGPR